MKCDLCGAEVSLGVTGSACAACLAALRLVRALGSSGRRLSYSQRGWIARSVSLYAEMVDGQAS
eukprot:12584644-Alexandrium_andersonii.AAC.1